MVLTFRNNFIGYFRFFYSGTGYKLIVNFVLCVIVGFLDGMGLAMFIPLLQVVGDNNGSSVETSTNQFHYLTDFLRWMGLGLTIDTVLVVIIILFLLKGFLKFVQLNYQVKLRFAFISKLRKTLVDQLHDLSYKGFLKLDAGRVQNILTTEMQRLYQGMNAYLSSGQSFVMLLTYIILAFIANFQFAFFVAAGAGLSNLIYRKIYTITKRSSFELSKRGNKFNGYLIQAIHNFKYLKSTSYFDNFSRKLKRVIEQMEFLNSRIGFYNAVTQSLKEPVIVIIVVLVVYVELNFMGAGLSSIVLSLLLFYRALGFLVTVQNNWQNFINNIGSLTAISGLSSDMVSMKEIKRTKEFPGFRYELLVDKISFSYGSVQVINDVSLKISKNKTIALVGESGSGKTTLANLIAGLMEPDHGAVKADGISLVAYNANSYRSKIGYISQEPVIFNDNIFNNVTFWAEQTEENVQQFWKAVELASLKSFIHSLPGKEQTNLGDNGILISGGQRQRISIARELYKEAEILIMDEATSALDSETERAIRQNMDELHGSYTIIIIAHRLSTIKSADSIYLLDKGKIIASGSFDEIINVSERFRRMVTLQEIS